jgi:hypothetical protein
VTSQPVGGTKGRRSIAIAAAAVAVAVVVALIALIVSLVSGSDFDDPDELRSAMADVGYSCEPEGPSGDRGQWLGQICALEDGGRLGLRVYESGDLFDADLADAKEARTPLVYGANWFIEATFSPTFPENYELLTRMAECLDAETLNLDL